MPRRSARPISILCSVLLLGAYSSCLDASPESTGTEQAPIVGGVVESGYLGVGALLVDEGGGYFSLCTGTVIAEGWVLTAGHCVDGVDATAVTFITDENVESATDFHSVRAIHLHPGYALGTSGPENNLALLEVFDLTGIPTHDMNRDPISVGLAVTWVGYGIDDTSPASGDGIRRRGLGTIAELYATRYTYYFSGAMPCNGDSGAPAFATVGGGQRIVGVVSHGDETCSAFGVDTRVDPYLGWIDDVLAGAPTDADADAETDGEADAAPDGTVDVVEDGLDFADVVADLPTEAEADAPADAPFEDTTSLPDDASEDVPDDGGGDEGCGCRAAGSPASATRLAGFLLLGLCVRSRRR